MDETLKQSKLGRDHHFRLDLQSGIHPMDVHRPCQLLGTGLVNGSTSQRYGNAVIESSRGRM